MIDEARYKEWIEVSFALGKAEPFFIPTIQGLGRLDSKLIYADAKSSPPQGKTFYIDESAELTDRFTYSFLWVLGAYELIRTLDQRCRANPMLLGEEINNKVNILKHKIGRLRVPLAKMEPARKYKETDEPIAYPAFHKTLGISWRISNTTYITRRELSDEALSLFEEIRSRAT